MNWYKLSCDRALRSIEFSETMRDKVRTRILSQARFSGLQLVVFVCIMLALIITVIVAFCMF